MFRRKPTLLLSLFSLLLILAPTVSAQISPVVPGTITVLGEGSASAPAEEANILITIGADSYIYYDDMMMLETQPTEGTPAPVAGAVDVAAIVDAIVAHGVPVNDVNIIETAFMGEWGSGMDLTPTSIHVKIMQPTVEEISELLEVVRTAAHDEGLFVNQFGVMYAVEDCRAIRQEARADAVANARAEAEDQAAALNTGLGGVVASRDTYPMNTGYYQSNSCMLTADAIPYSMIYMAGQFDPSIPAEVTVFVAVEVSFEIP